MTMYQLTVKRDAYASPTEKTDHDFFVYSYALAIGTPYTLPSGGAAIEWQGCDAGSGFLSDSVGPGLLHESGIIEHVPLALVSVLDQGCYDVTEREDGYVYTVETVGIHVAR